MTCSRSMPIASAAASRNGRAGSTRSMSSPFTVIASAVRVCAMFGYMTIDVDVDHRADGVQVHGGALLGDRHGEHGVREPGRAAAGPPAARHRRAWSAHRCRPPRRRPPAAGRRRPRRAPGSARRPGSCRRSAGGAGRWPGSARSRDAGRAWPGWSPRPGRATHALESRVNSRLGSGSMTKSSGEASDDTTPGRLIGRRADSSSCRSPAISTSASSCSSRSFEQRSRAARQPVADVRLAQGVVHGVEPGLRHGQRLAQQVGQVQHLDAPAGQRRGERVVLVLRPVHPRDAVEQQPVVVARGQPAQLRPRPVQHDRAQASYFTVRSSMRRPYLCGVRSGSCRSGTRLRRVSARPLVRCRGHPGQGRGGAIAATVRAAAQHPERRPRRRGGRRQQRRHLAVARERRGGRRPARAQPGQGSRDGRPGRRTSPAHEAVPHALLLHRRRPARTRAVQTSALVAPVVAGRADMTIAVLPTQKTAGGGRGFVVGLARGGHRATRPGGRRPSRCPACAA